MGLSKKGVKSMKKQSAELKNIIAIMAHDGEKLSAAESAYVASCTEVADGTLTTWIGQCQALSSALNSNYRYLDIIRNAYRNFLVTEIRNNNQHVGFISGWLAFMDYLPKPSAGKVLKPELVKYTSLETGDQIFSLEVFEHNVSASDAEVLERVLTSGSPIFKHQLTNNLAKDLDFIEIDCDNFNAIESNNIYSLSAAFK